MRRLSTLLGRTWGRDEHRESPHFTEPLGGETSTGNPSLHGAIGGETSRNPLLHGATWGERRAPGIPSLHGATWGRDETPGIPSLHGATWGERRAPGIPSLHGATWGRDEHRESPHFTEPTWGRDEHRTTQPCKATLSSAYAPRYGYSADNLQQLATFSVRGGLERPRAAKT